MMLCERGIRTFEPSYRFTLDLMAVPVLRELSHLPDRDRPEPRGRAAPLVQPLSLAAAAAGADGIIVEVHPSPRRPSATVPRRCCAEDFADYLRKVEAAASSWPAKSS